MSLTELRSTLAFDKGADLYCSLTSLVTMSPTLSRGVTYLICFLCKLLPRFGYWIDPTRRFVAFHTNKKRAGTATTIFGSCIICFIFLFDPMEDANYKLEFSNFLSYATHLYQKWFLCSQKRLGLGSSELGNLLMSRWFFLTCCLFGGTELFRKYTTLPFYQAKPSNAN